MKHIHKYVRKKYGKGIIYRCILPGCTHFIQRPLLEGRTCICNRCNTPFLITKRTLKSCPAKPHCENCYKNRDKVLDDVIESLIRE